ncbi:MAG TPA: hypothetical protein VN366_10970 [Feifaniaceae bacterium]|nr:hypothetical protein [Feifaniaceae bacterium]
MRKARQHALLRPQHILLGCCLVLLALMFIYFSQSAKLAEIEKEKTQLNESYEAMLLEEQRLNGMLGYVQTDDYMMQYAREKLGYVSPDDYKFYRDTPQE